MAVSELPGNPNAVWTVKTNAAGSNCHCVYSVLCAIMEAVSVDVCAAGCDDVLPPQSECLDVCDRQIN